MEYKGVKIEWLGHSAFLIRDGKKRYYIDPFQIESEESADIIFITHSHFDHCSIEDIMKISKNGTVIVAPADCQSKATKIQQKIDLRPVEPMQEVEINSIKVKTVPAYNLNKQFHPKSEEWVGYVLELGDIKLYHSGDTDFIPEMKQLGEIDIAMLPVSGTYVMTAQEAAKAAIIIKPKKAIPMHYGSAIGTLDDALKFVEICEQEGIDAEVLEKS